MAFKYSVTDQNEIYFITTTVVGWIDAFTRKELAEVIIESLKYCQSEKGLIIYAEISKNSLQRKSSKP